MRTTRSLFIGLALSLLAPSSFAQTARPDQFRVIGGVGSALSPSAGRLGFGAWEFGLLNSVSVGAAKQVFFDENLYVIFGGGWGVSLDLSVAVYGGLGWEPRLFWNVYFRGEMNAGATTRGQVNGELLAALALRFF